MIYDGLVVNILEVTLSAYQLYTCVPLAPLAESVTVPAPPRPQRLPLVTIGGGGTFPDPQGSPVSTTTTGSDAIVMLKQLIALPVCTEKLPAVETTI